MNIKYIQLDNNKKILKWIKDHEIEKRKNIVVYKIRKKCI